MKAVIQDHESLVNHAAIKVSDAQFVSLLQTLQIKELPSPFLREMFVWLERKRPIGKLNWAGIAARKEDPEIVAWMDEELTRLKDSGEIYALQEKWFGFEMELSDTIPSFS